MMQEAESTLLNLVGFIGYVFSSITVDDLARLAPVLIALLAVIYGPRMQFLIARKQVAMQAEIAERQVKMQAEISARQIATQTQIATRQIADNISSKRQNWIDELRKDAAEFLTVLVVTEDLKRSRSVAITGRDEIDAKLANLGERGVELAIRIRLRLNPKEDDHNKLSAQLQELANLSNDGDYGTPQKIVAHESKMNEVRDGLLDTLQKILKKEWDRVKSGDL